METAPIPDPLSAAGFGPPWEAPAPVLFNAWKHHAGFLRQRIREAAGPGSVGTLAGAMVVIGTELMDLYLGRLTPAEIGTDVIAVLREAGRLDAATFPGWVAAGGGYRVIDLPADASRWVLRLGDAAGRYVPAHPPRRGAHPRHVRAHERKAAGLPPGRAQRAA